MWKVIPVTLSSDSMAFSLVFIDGGRSYLVMLMDAVSNLQEKLELIAGGAKTMRINSLHAQPLRLTQPSYVKHSTRPVQMAFFSMYPLWFASFIIQLFPSKYKKVLKLEPRRAPDDLNDSSYTVCATLHKQKSVLLWFI